MDDLATRTGLPEALRVLVEKYPREGWEAHPEFNALTRFWLDRHLMFRDLQGRLIAETQGFLDRRVEPAIYGGRLVRLAGQFINDLHGHHQIEDHSYFPILAEQDARLVAGFELLERDHQAIDPLLHQMVDHANALLGDIGEARKAERLLGDFTEFARLLDRHLIDEEELVVPVILEYRGAGVS